MTKPHKESLPIRDVLVNSRHDLVLVAARPGNRVEVVDGARRGHNSGAVGQGPKIKKRSGRGIDAIGWNDIAGEWCRRGVASRASPLSVHVAAARIHDRNVDG